MGPCFCFGFPSIIFFLITVFPGFGDLFPFFTSFIFLFADILFVTFIFFNNKASFLISLGSSLFLLLLFVLIILLSLPLLLLRIITLFSLFSLFLLLILTILPSFSFPSFSLILLFILTILPSFSLLLFFKFY